MTGLSQAITPQPYSVSSPNFPTAVSSPIYSNGSLQNNFNTEGQNTENTLYYPYETPKYIMTFLINNFNRSSLFNVGTTTASGYPALVMPLPSQMVDPNHVDWREIELSATFQSVIGGLAAGAASVATKGATAGAAPGLGQGIGGALGGLTSIATSLLGVAPNQFMTMLMRGPTYKRHKFTWDLSPNTFQEADQLRQIINTFKNAMAPSINNGTNNPGSTWVNNLFTGAGFSPLIWQYPCIFYISVYPNSMFMYKFMPCICDYFVVNYMPGGRGAFYRNTTGQDGANPPEGVQIQANFIELQFWTAGSYDDSNDPSVPWTGYNNLTIPAEAGATAAAATLGGLPSQTAVNPLTGTVNPPSIAGGSPPGTQ